MKSVLLAFCCIITISATACLAQASPIDKGSWMASGGFSYTNYSDRDVSVFTIDPTFSYFLAPGFAGGLSLLYRHQSSGIDYTTIGIGPNATYYIDLNNSGIKKTKTTYLFMGLSALIAKESASDNWNSSDRSISQIAFDFGVMMMISRNAGIHVKMNYLSQKYEDADSEEIFSLVSGFSYFIF